jgi:hypothetical protein
MNADVSGRAFLGLIKHAFAEPIRIMRWRR